MITYEWQPSRTTITIVLVFGMLVARVAPSAASEPLPNDDAKARAGAQATATAREPFESPQSPEELRWLLDQQDIRQNQILDGDMYAPFGQWHLKSAEVQWIQNPTGKTVKEPLQNGKLPPELLQIKRNSGVRRSTSSPRFGPIRMTSLRGGET